MRNRSRYLLLLLCSLSLSAWGAYSFLPEYLTKKMSKHLNKVFGKEVVVQELMVPDSLNMDHQLFTVYRNDSITGYAIITRALGCRIGGCDKPALEKESFEQFFFMTAFDKNKQIKRVRVLEYTSKYGYQIANRGWLKQFEGGSAFTVGQNVDGISGATVSAKSITKNVNDQVRIAREYF